jgi:hypothetical protein
MNSIVAKPGQWPAGLLVNLAEPAKAGLLVELREWLDRAERERVAGLQFLFSVYLLAMWVLTYFGRPFG